MTPSLTSSGHCRVTVVAPNNRVDVALPEDIALADLLPEVLRLVGGSNLTDAEKTFTGYVLTGPGGWPLHTGMTLTTQGIVHGDLLRLRPSSETPEPPVHDEIVDAVAEAALTTGQRWTAKTLRTTSLAALALALTLGATALWFSAASYPGTFHGRPSVLAAALAAATFTAGITRARLGGKLKTWSTQRPTPAATYRAYRRRVLMAHSNFGPDRRSTMSLGNERPAHAGHGQSQGRRFPDGEAHYGGSRDAGYPDPHRSFGTGQDFLSSGWDREASSYLSSSSPDAGESNEGAIYARPRSFAGDEADLRGSRSTEVEIPPSRPLHGSGWSLPRPTNSENAANDYGPRGGSGAFVPGSRVAGYSGSLRDGTTDSSGFYTGGDVDFGGPSGARARFVGSSNAAWPGDMKSIGAAPARSFAADGDLPAGIVLTTCALPYAFLAGLGVMPTDLFSGLGRAQFTVGAAALLMTALATMIGLGRRIEAAVAGAVLGLIGTTAGIIITLTHATPASAAAVTGATCVLVIAFLPGMALRAVFFPIDPPIGGARVTEYDNEPVNTSAVTARSERSDEILTGLTAGVGVTLAIAVAVLSLPAAAMGTSPRGTHTIWEQTLAGIIAAAALCRARMFRRREQVLSLAISGLSALTIVTSALSMEASPTIRSSWLLAALTLTAFIALALSTVRARRGTTEAILLPTWSRAIDTFENTLFLALLPVLLAVLGLYGTARSLSS